MKSQDSWQSCDVIGQCLKVMTPDKIRRIGRIFDIQCAICKFRNLIASYEFRLTNRILITISKIRLVIFFISSHSNLIAIGQMKFSRRWDLKLYIRGLMELVPLAGILHIGDCTTDVTYDMYIIYMIESYVFYCFV